MHAKDPAHNLLIVSDMHIAEGLEAEAGECCYGLDAFLYDGAFARFLRYHEQMRRDAHDRGDDPLSRPWRLVLAGDVFDFWDVARVPGDAQALREALESQIQEIGIGTAAGVWLRGLKTDLAAKEAGFEVSERDYAEIRNDLDALNLQDGRQRRNVEALTWWTEVLVQRQGAELSRRERRHGLGTTWQDVVWKINHIYQGHTEFFGALAWFIACGNEVILLKGNHDIELHWPEVHDGHLPYLLADAYRELHGGGTLSPAFDDYPPELWEDVDGNPLPDENGFRQLLPTYALGSQGQPPGQRFAFEDWFYCEPDLVYVEHGNQYEPADASVRFLQPLLPSDPKRIELPWGAFMVRYFYNKILAAHPFAVNVKPEHRIIHWMMQHDLFRLLGIVLAELPDILRGLARAVKQGFRGTWIWGDHSISGLIPLLIYDGIQLASDTRQEQEWEADARTLSRRSELAASYSQQLPADQLDAVDQLPPPDRRRLWARFLFHLGAFGTILCLLLAGAGCLFGWTWRGWLAIPLALFAAVGVAGAVRSVHLGREKGQHSLGEILLQIGVVGAIAGLIADLFLVGVVGWTLITGLLLVFVPLAAAAVGWWLIRRTADHVQDPTLRLFRRSWQAKSLRSGASLFLELGLLSTVVGAIYLFSLADSEQGVAWLKAAIALLIWGWAAQRLHSVYVNRARLDRMAVRSSSGFQQGLRTASTVLVVLLALGLLLAPLAWLVKTAIQSLFTEGASDQAAGIAGFAEWVYEIMTTQYIFGMPVLVTLVLAMVSVVLLETGAHWLLERQRNRKLRQMEARARRQSRAAAAGAQGSTAASPSLADQLEEIQELARTEQRRWLGSLLGILTVLLPFVAAGLLGLAIAGGVVALVSFIKSGAAETLRVLGISFLLGLAYWLLRQISASFRRQDPQSGFGDLFYRMAVNIADILATPERGREEAGLGRPRYFVFGHDHWADSKPLVGSRGAETGAGQQWYVNTGTWLRGYVEEQQQQEVNENHSTFVQIIPGVGEGEAPRVLRWNDRANQPEHIVRRKEPEPTSEEVWSRWEGGWLWVLVWGILLAITWRLAPAGWMTQLWPLVWILGLWLVSWFLVDTGRELLKRRPGAGPAPDPADVTDVHCHVGVLGDQHPEWGGMSESYRQLPVYKAMLLYGRIEADQVSDDTLRAATETAIAESQVGHIVCLALDPVYDQNGQRREDWSYVWVDNEYILSLQQSLGPKVLLGASVHPYDPAFRERVAHYVKKGAVLLKWLPSAQQIDLADDRVREALGFLATAKGGNPLPLLLHVGPEYAIPSSDPSFASYDYLSWTWWDSLRDRLGGGAELHRPDTPQIEANLQAGLSAGAVIIFAHCGLPYYAPRRLRRIFEHSELRTIRRYLKRYPADGSAGGRCYTDISACVTPFRRSYFGAIRRLPPESLLFGSDFPTPVFELSADLGEMVEDLTAVLDGHLDRVLVPEDNLIDVNYRELQVFFPGHPMFNNFDALR